MVISRAVIILKWVKIIYYRLAVRYAGWRENARDEYVRHAVKTRAVRVFLTADDIFATRPDGGGLTLDFIVRVAARMFPGDDDRLFVEALFAPSALGFRVNGRPADVIAVKTLRAGRDGRDNYWSVSITATVSEETTTAGCEVILEAGSASATFVIGPSADDTKPYQVPGVREFVRLLRPEDFIDRQ